MMTSEAKRVLSKTIRGLRTRLLTELHEATESEYLLNTPAERASLNEAARKRRERLESWIGEQLRSLGKAARKEAAQRLRVEVEKEAAATLLVRLTYLRLLEASGLRPVKVLTGGWDSAAYKTFRQLAPELIHDDPSEGYATLLDLIFDDLALELPGVFGRERVSSLVPIPPATLRAVVDALDAPELEGVWTDDTALGWVYQYWNDPEREALDKKLHENKKLENHEIASKTQMFTERYMVEWLLQNSLGSMWLAMCKKHGWTADVHSQGVLETLDARRAEWRKQREAAEVALDALMPIAPGLEERWKYWVPQPMPEDAVAAAPETLRSLKLLDPACGSGHFLVIACDLLFALYQEEARHRGEQWSDRSIVESILQNNLHGIDLDPNAVRIAAASLMLKAKQLCREAVPHSLNLVATNLSLASLPHDDPARMQLHESVEREIGIPRALTEQILKALEGADHLGTLLKVDTEVEAALKAWEDKLGRRRAQQGKLFDHAAFEPVQRELVGLDEARETLLDKVEEFLAHHTSGQDLGLRLQGEQLAAGVRFLRMVREGQYDLVVGNPPYQGTSKMADAAYVQKHYPRGKADLYAAFLERGLQLAREGGVSALLTMRNWMFIKQYSALREWLLQAYDLRVLGDVDRGAFEEVPDEVVSAVMSVFRKAAPSGVVSVAMQPTPLEDKARDGERTKRKRAAVLCGVGRLEFGAKRFDQVEGSPMVYWWDDRALLEYARSAKLGTDYPIRQGLKTSDNARFLRRVWECASIGTERAARWAACVGGGDGGAWVDPLVIAIKWINHGLEIKTLAQRLYGSYTRTITSESFYFRSGGIAFSKIGSGFKARLHRAPCVMESAGSSLYSDSPNEALCLMNSARARSVLQSLNPTSNFTVGDVNRLPMLSIGNATEVVEVVDTAFSVQEGCREPSVEFKHPGPSPWRYAQAWAQRAVDRPDGEPLPPYDPEYDPEPPTDHLSFALGVTLGRFGANGEGILDRAPDTAAPHGIFYVSAASDSDSLAHPSAAPLLAAWEKHGKTIDPKRTLKEYLAEKFFGDVHRKMYENRPIYFPLSSKSKSFVAYVSIHRWTADTLRALLAAYLYPEKKSLEGQREDLRNARQQADKKKVREAEKTLDQVDKWLQELDAFLKLVEQCAEKGPPPTDEKCKPRERDARYDPDLDDGVMINAAALWPLLEAQWKEPAKWWKELANAEGKKDYDWAHLAARYFPKRVDGKCQKDPSLGVAHGCFWKYHPEKAYQWELRLQDEIGPDFRLDEPARTIEDAYGPAWVQLSSDAYREAFEGAHPEKVSALVAAEEKRREKKRKKGGDEEVEQGELSLDDEGDEHDGEDAA